MKNEKAIGERPAFGFSCPAEAGAEAGGYAWGGEVVVCIPVLLPRE